MKVRVLMVLSALALIALSSFGIASAAGPQATDSRDAKLGVNPKTGVITGCQEPTGANVSKETRGDLKLSNCAPGYKIVKWNIRGPKGAAGAAGARGPAGADGKNGLDGKNGVNGAAGAQGPAGPAGAPAPTLLRLSGQFCGTNATVATSLDGVQFGPYTDGGAWGGSVCYNGFNGHTLDEITQLSYTVKHSTPGDNPIGSPYLRIFLADQDEDGYDEDVIFDATKCATVVPDEDVFLTHEVTTGDVRYDDDPCVSAASQQPWADVVAAHGDEEVTGIYVTTGFTGGEMLTAILRSLKVNGTDFVFGAA